MPYPRMMRIRQRFEEPPAVQVEDAVRQALAKLPALQRIRSGESVAIPVGSRGIARIPIIIRTMVAEVKAKGAHPFIVPAMGSHGGGTAEGQRAIVEGYGVTEQSVGAPIRATMDVEQVGTSPEGIPVFFDRYASEAHHVIVVGRVRPHTDFTGEIESGLHKMMLIGLGKHHGARVYHQAFVQHSFDRIIQSVAQTVIRECRILMGLAIVESAHHEVALVEAVAPEDFLQREKELLVLAKRWLPRLPFQKVDLLIVDRMGKNISGTGMDSNVIGRKYYVHYPAPDEWPKITRVFVRDLTDETKGNATGIGFAEFTTTRLVSKIDPRLTWINTMTGNRPYLAAVPIHFPTDREALDAALQTVGYMRPEEAKLIRVRSTLDLEEMLVSEAYGPEMDGREEISILEPARAMAFDENGDLLPF